MDRYKTSQLNILIADLRNIPAQNTDDPLAIPNIASMRPESVLARRLVAIALGAFLGRVPTRKELALESRPDRGKPYFPAFPDFHYNISHSGDYVVCAVSDHPVGIDLQKINDNAERCLKIARRFFSEEEQNAMQKLIPDPNNTEASKSSDSRDKSAYSPLCVYFTRCWTAREAYIKLTGRGLAEPFESFRPDLNAKRILVRDSDDVFLLECEAPPGYCMSRCSYKEKSGLVITKY